MIFNLFNLFLILIRTSSESSTNTESIFVIGGTNFTIDEMKKAIIRESSTQ
jgi:hypothetical protein